MGFGLIPANSSRKADDGLPISGSRPAGTFTLLPFLRISVAERDLPIVRISRAFKYSFCVKTRLSRIEPSFSISLDIDESSPAATDGGFEPGGGGGPSARTRPRLAASILPADGVSGSAWTVFGSEGMPVISGVPDGIEFEFPFDTTPGWTPEFTEPFEPAFEFVPASGGAPHAPNRTPSKITLRYFIKTISAMRRSYPPSLPFNDTEFSCFPVRRQSP